MWWLLAHPGLPAQEPHGVLETVLVQRLHTAAVGGEQALVQAFQVLNGELRMRIQGSEER